MNVLFMGPQGSGKSTQAGLLAQDLSHPLVQAGEIFRTISLIDDSPTARLVKEIIDNGKLVPMEIATAILNRRLSQSDCAGGFVMDGYPRNYEQFKPLKVKLDKVFYINLSREEAVKRLKKRGREDDTEEIIKERLAIYHQETEPLLQVFREVGILSEINGERLIAQIHRDIVRQVGVDDLH